MNVIMAGGGTAGHVFPALATADALRDHHDATVTFIGARDGQEARIVPAAGYPFTGVHVSPAQSRVSLVTLRAVGLALREARACRPVVGASDVVVSIGGYASAPAALAARRTRRPLVLIEPNSVPGIVNRIAARWAAAAAVTFDATASRLPHTLRVERTGNPIRSEIASVIGHRADLADEARVAFGLQKDRATILVVGGSQGARHIDEAVAGALAFLRDRSDVQLLVSTGPAHTEIVTEAIDQTAALLVRVVPFIERMDLALALADIAVSRSGGSVAELAACRIPAILVPYPHATEQHQEANAREVVAAGAATMILDADLSSSALAGCMLELMDDDDRRRQMAASARAWARPDAAERIAALVAEIAGSRDG